MSGRVASAHVLISSGQESTVKPACWATRMALRSSVAISHPRDSARATHIASPSDRNRLDNGRTAYFCVRRVGLAEAEYA